MKVRYYYNPVVRTTPDGFYSVDIYMDKKGEGVLIGTVVNNDWAKALMGTQGIIDFLTDHYSSISVIRSKRDIRWIKDIVYHFV